MRGRVLGISEFYHDSAAALARDGVGEWATTFVGHGRARFADWRRDSPLATLTHVDGSARLRTVSREDNPRVHPLLSAFRRRAGGHVLLASSFNLRGEPVVSSPEDAIRTFAHGLHDALDLGPDVVLQTEQAPEVLEAIDAPRCAAN